MDLSILHYFTATNKRMTQSFHRVMEQNYYHNHYHHEYNNDIDIIVITIIILVAITIPSSIHIYSHILIINRYVLFHFPIWP